MKHAVKLADAFELLDIGQGLYDTAYTTPCCLNNSGGGNHGRRPGHVGGGGGNNGRGGGGRSRGGRGGGNKNNNNTGSGAGTKTEGTRETPINFWDPRKRQGIRHFLKDCPDCPKEEKKALYTKHHEERRSAPSASTPSQKQTETPTQAATSALSVKPTTGRIHKHINPRGSPSCTIIGTDGSASHTGTGRCDDGSDVSLA